ncbi:MAG TPA: DNA double-strand break repair nuclease NurA [Anaerolineae bacterium]|nr:DNA double-strand break repair nuclease NurA [Anaerolineae bacterium]
MTLELNKIRDQLTAMGQTTAQRTLERERLMPEVRDLLSQHADSAELLTKIRRAQAAGWFGAIPAAERIDRVFDPPPLPRRMTIIAADGSQIYPDQHGLALYYVINVGSIVLRLGSGATPLCETTPTIGFYDTQLYNDDDLLISSQAINARRAVEEMAQLAKRAGEEAGPAPIVALLDGNLALNAQHETISATERDELLKLYLAGLDTLKSDRVALAGFVARSGTTSVIKLLELATCPLDEVASRVKNRKGRPFSGLIVDTRLFEGMLAPGQRSAAFQMHQGWIRMYGEAGHTIHLFYLNVGAPNHPNIARVEVPGWVAADPELLGLVHGAIVEQCRVTERAYPYVLTRADELAVIRSDEKANFDRLIGVELQQRGIESHPSEKAATKALARYGRR